MPIVVNINLSARAKPRAAEALRRAGYEIEEFEGLSEPISTGRSWMAPMKIDFS